MTGTAQSLAPTAPDPARTPVTGSPSGLRHPEQPQHPPPGEAPPESASGSDFCRIAVAGPRSRADLAVPLGVPLARLMPALLRHAGEEIGPDGGVRHEGWVLRTADGARLEGARTLGAQEVREGDVLLLGHGTDDFTPPLYDDVVEVIGSASVRAPSQSSGVRRWAAAFAAVGVVGAAVALAGAPGTPPGLLALATALAALGLGALLSRAFADVAAGTCAVVLATPLAAVGAVRLLGWGPGTGDGFGAAQLLLACAVVAAVAATGPALVGGGDGTFVALVIGGTLACLGAGIATVWDTGPARAAAVAGPLALALTTLWPVLALRAAHLPGPQLASSAEELEELPGPLEHEALRVRVDRARRLLTGMLVGSHLVLLGGALALLASGELWASVLAGVLGLLVLLRARLFRDAAQTGATLAAGLGVLLCASIAVVANLTGHALPLLGAVLPVSLLVALVACAVGLFSGRRALNPRLARFLDVVETLLLLAVVPLVLAVWDVYTALLELKA